MQGKRFSALSILLAPVLTVAGWGGLASAADGEEATAWVSPGVPHPGSDQIFWVPTFTQAQEMARATGRLMVVMGSVGDWNGY